MLGCTESPVRIVYRALLRSSPIQNIRIKRGDNYPDAGGSASIGGGFPWTGRCRRLRWVGKKTGPNPTDRAKGGTKRSVLTEAAGISVGVSVDAANRVDFKLVRETLESIPIRRPRPTKQSPQGLCLDKGYDYAEVDALVEEFRFTGHIARRGQEARKIKRSARKRHDAGWWSEPTFG